MKDKQDVLEAIGLSKNESKVYLFLLRLGSSTATEITKESCVHRSNVYDALESLIKKGCVSYIKKMDRTYFAAANPENLKNILREKQLRQDFSKRRRRFWGKRKAGLSIGKPS